MKRIIEEVSGDGLKQLLGKKVQLWCINYIYTGTLIGVNDKDVCLGEPAVVYETGPLGESGFKDAQPTGKDELFIRTSAIESYGLA